MLDINALTLDPSGGDRLIRAEYHLDFDQRDAEIRGHDSWKFERRQHFEEQNYPSREALRRGDWEQALSLLEEQRNSLRKSAREDRERGSVFRRVRVVGEPLTPYVQWELNALRVQAECGMEIRVVGADRVAPFEISGLLPEVVTLGGETLYEIVYTESGVPDGAIRFTDPGIVRNWEYFIKELYEEGEDVTSYFAHHVAHLPPPRAA